MKNYLYIPLLTAITALTACDGSDTATVQRPDGYDYITFMAQPQTVLTRTNPYEDYDATKHPGTMGVMGYYDISTYNALNTERTVVSTPNPVFDNQTLTYKANATIQWDYSPRRKWDDYRGAQSFDFFAYMPQCDGALVTRSTEDADTYTLSFPFSLPDGTATFSDQRQAPVICALPVHKEGTDASGEEFTFERTVEMKFDQTLTAYRLLFRLDERMGAIRQFRIKAVNISGGIATRGTVERTYHWKDSEWTADDIAWTITARLADGTSLSVPNTPDADGNTSLAVTATNYTQWGGTVYLIPDKDLLPVITVKYDVEFLDQDGATVVTRKDVTSAITMNRTNFSSLTAGGIAMVNPVRILIQPRYLYVLADQDAYTGYLLVE